MSVNPVSNPSPAQQAPSAPPFSGWTYAGRSVLAGAAGGATVAGIFTPVDRMINVASNRGIPFRQAFVEVVRHGPYRGLAQTVGQRALQGVTNMPLYDFGKWGLDKLTGSEGTQKNAFASGILMGGLAGAGYGVISTPKYQTWRTNETLLPTLKRMMREGGVRAFTKGVSSTALRDMAFGGVFYPIKTYGMAWAKQPHADGTERSGTEIKKRSTAANAAAVSAGVFASAPLNYTRTRAYNTAPSEVEPGIVNRLGSLVKEAKSSHHAAQVVRQRLVFGAGASRAVLGMFLQTLIYDALTAR